MSSDEVNEVKYCEFANHWPTFVSKLERNEIECFQLRVVIESTSGKFVSNYILIILEAVELKLSGLSFRELKSSLESKPRTSFQHIEAKIFLRVTHEVENLGFHIEKFRI